MGYIQIATSGVTDKKYQAIVQTNKNAVVTAKNNTAIKTFKVKNGIALISKLTIGTWEIGVTVGNWYGFETLTITGNNDRHVISLYQNMVPQFSTSMLSYKIYNDDDNELNELIGTNGDWKIKLLAHTNTTGGIINFSNMHGQKVDIFIVGGGGNGCPQNGYWGSCGGGGGYTRTIKGITIKEDTDYYAVIGGACGDSSFSCSDGSFKYVAGHGQSGYQADDTRYGGNGGCGGGGGSSRYGESQAGRSGNGGSNGGDGTAGVSGGWNDSNTGQWYSGYSQGGYGQKNKLGPNGEGTKTDTYDGNTYEFGEEGRKKYSSGGAGGYDGTLTSGLGGIPGDGIREANSGAGGNGTLGNKSVESGFSGVVIIRNARG